MNGHEKDMCYDEIGLCAQRNDHLGLIENTDYKDHVVF